MSDTCNFPESVFQINRNRPGHTAYIDQFGQFSYSELENYTRGLASNLAAIGVNRGDRVLISRHDDRFTVIAMMSCMLMGAIPIMVHGRSSQTYFELCFTQAKPQWIISGDHTLTWSLNKLPYNTINTSQLESMSHPGLFKANESEGDDLGYWLFTSGTTGQPRAVIHSQRNLLAVGHHYGVITDGMTFNDRVYSTAKLSFAYGLCHSLASTLVSGATSILTTKLPTPESVLHTMRVHRPSIFVTVPSVYALLIKSGLDFTNLGITQCVSAGENLSSILQTKWQKLTGIPLLNLYGCTELCGTVLANTIDDAEIGTVGRPTHGYCCEIRDNQGHPVPPGTVGELWAKGPSLALGYHDAREAFGSGWFRSHDLFYQNTQGRFVFQGRSNDIFKVHGQWVNPIEIEDILMQLDDISEVGVCGSTNDQGLTEIVAHVIPVPEAKINKHKLRSHVRQHLDHHKCPKHINVVEELPKTINGKLQRSKLKQPLL
jgi:benzoate-CoA ligase